MLELENLTVNIGNRDIVSDVSLKVSEHDLFMVIGPNGAGKTTLFRAVMGMLPYKGKALYAKRDIKDFKPRELAQRIGVLTQKHNPQFAHTVHEIVTLGRYAYHKGIFSDLTSVDISKIEEAICLTGIGSIMEQSILTLSGGELQRVFLAQLLAQDPDLLILDEPTNHLDIQYQIAIFKILQEWIKQKGRAVLAVVHDLNIVYTYGTKAILMNEGRIHAQGKIEEVLNRECLKAVYKVDVAQWMQSLLKHWAY